MKRYIQFFILFAGFQLVSCSKTPAQEVEHLTAAEAHQLLLRDSTLFVLDVRTEEEYSSETGHLKGASLIPVDELEGRLAEVPRGKKVLTYCRTGRRSEAAAAILMRNGIPGITMDGGILAWIEQGYTVER